MAHVKELAKLLQHYFVVSPTMDRFNFISTQEIDSRVRHGVPEGTRMAMTFALQVYEEWVKVRSSAFPEKQFPFLADLPIVSKFLLIQTLSHLVFEIRRQDGKEYPPGTSIELCAV